MNMKKIVLTLVAMMAVTFSFAKSSADERFDMNCDIYRLAVTLDLNEQQMDAVEEIQDNFTNEMQSIAKLNNRQQRHGIHQAVRNDAKQMREVLTDTQFRAYMRILFETLRNRNL